VASSSSFSVKRRSRGALERWCTGRRRERVAGEAGDCGGGVDVELGRWITMERNRVREESRVAAAGREGLAGSGIRFLRAPSSNQGRASSARLLLPLPERAQAALLLPLRTGGEQRGRHR
jgi:hypothetical protein